MEILFKKSSSTLHIIYKDIWPTKKANRCSILKLVIDIPGDPFYLLFKINQDFRIKDAIVENFVAVILIELFAGEVSFLD